MAKPGVGRQGRNTTCWEKLRQGAFSRGEFLDFPDDSPAHDVVESLHLTQTDLRRMKTKFMDVDVDGSGEIDYNEFFELIDETRSAYADALFQLIDVDGSGTISFEEMIQVRCALCVVRCALCVVRCALCPQPTIHNPISVRNNDTMCLTFDQHTHTHN